MMKKFDKLFFGRINESWKGMRVDELVGYLLPKCQEMLTIERLKQLLSNKDDLRIKFGIDPTASDVHLGHIVPIMLLNQFAKVGYHIDLIIGDFTAQVGDPTEREVGRVPLSQERISRNMVTYSSQIGKYIDSSLLDIHFNSSWLNSMSLQDVFGIFQKVNLSEAMQRDDFRERARNSQAVSLAEVCYGVLMGIDSVHLKTDIEIGGIDQLLNFQQCRKIMREQGLDEEVILMTPILEGTSGDGRKMSKSFDNYIAVNASCEDKFGKVMSIPDRLILRYFCSFADVHQSEIDELREFIKKYPLEAKKQLATFVVSLETKNLEDGLRYRDDFERRFSVREIKDEDCIFVTASGEEILIDVLMKTNQFKSRNELRRLFQQTAVRIVDEGGRILSVNSSASDAVGVVKVGKRRYFKVTLVS